MHRSLFTDTVTVHAGDTHRAIAPGDLVDLGERVTEALTLGQALGDLVGMFAPVPSDAVEPEVAAVDLPAPRKRTPRTPPATEETSS